MSANDIALFFHLMGVIAMFGGFALYHRAGSRLREATDLDSVRSWLGFLESSNPMFASGSVLLLLSGVYMMVTRWRAPHPWIVVAILSLLTIGIVGARVSRRHLQSMRAAVGEAHGSISGELASRIGEPAPWTTVSALNGLALGVVYVMTTKPGWIGSIAVALFAGGLGSVIGRSLLRRESPTAPVRARAAES